MWFYKVFISCCYPINNKSTNQKSEHKQDLFLFLFSVINQEMDSNPSFLFSRNRSWNVFLIPLLFCFLQTSYCYDPLDPNGNITLRWDVISYSGDGQIITFSIVNNQLFRHIDPPGWKLRWTWEHKQVIWNMEGAEATEQGNCSRFKTQPLPHCCLKEPVIIDLLPGAPYNKQVANCCKGGVLSSMMQQPDRTLGAFQLHIGGMVNVNNFTESTPQNITLGLDGYTCGPFKEVAATQFYEDNGRRKTQALATFNATCTYSQFRSSPSPSCCVSLSAFYDQKIVPCPACSCGCKDLPGSKCANKRSDLPPSPPLQHLHTELPPPVVICTNNMCPIQVHWHVKQSYTEYWRVKITITNQNYVRNYSDWTLVAQHPNFNNITQIFSFNYKPISQYGSINDTGMFYGLHYYNDMLLQAGRSGNVQTEMLMHKEKGVFSFREGWGFPRKINFNGDECVMPKPDDYPRLPNAAPSQLHAPLLPLVVSVALSLIVLLMNVC